MAPRKAEMKVRVWECGERGWETGGRCQDYASQEGGDEGESVGGRKGCWREDGKEWATPKQ